MGRKVWTRERLTAADVQSYLMDQTVMQFPSSATRDAAIPAPDEGMVCYLEDVDRFLWYDGTAWLYLGGDAPPDGSALTLTGFTAYTPRPPKWFRDGSGMINLEGAIFNTNAYTPPSAAVFTMPVGARPSENAGWVAACTGGNQFVRVSLNAAGVFFVNGPAVAIAAGVALYLDGIRYRAV